MDATAGMLGKYSSFSFLRFLFDGSKGVMAGIPA